MRTMGSNTELQQSSKEYSQRKYNEFVARFPKKLADKENSLVSRFSNHKGNPVNQLRDLYSFVDELMRVAAPFTACSKGGRGCSACCYLNVSVTDLEIQIIAEGAKLKTSKSVLGKEDFHGKACSFLKEGACSIYEFRPIRCRTHVNFDQTAYWCDPDRTMEFGLLNLRFSEVEKVFDSLRSGLPVYDIRQAFPGGSN